MKRNDEGPDLEHNFGTTKLFLLGTSVILCLRSLYSDVLLLASFYDDCIRGQDIKISASTVCNGWFFEVSSGQSWATKMHTCSTVVLSNVMHRQEILDIFFLNLFSSFQISTTHVPKNPTNIYRCLLSNPVGSSLIRACARRFLITAGAKLLTSWFELNDEQIWRGWVCLEIVWVAYITYMSAAPTANWGR